MKQKIIGVALLLLAFSVSAKSYKALYEEVEHSTQVPKEVLLALALTETGITTAQGIFMPWAYTLNWRGKSYRFNDKETACNSLNWIIKASNAVDIGETQLHWKYHDKAVQNACDYFDRDTAVYRTAKVLNECYGKRKNWVKAAGCYHRPAGGKLAEDYEIKFLVHLQNILDKEW